MQSFRLALRPLVIWLVAILAAFAVLGGIYHAYLTASPTRVFVVVDSSNPMNSVWSQVPDALDDISGRRYAEFSLATEKERVHGWSSTLDLGSPSAYAPRNLQFSYPEIEEADEIYLITNADSSETAHLVGWNIVRLGP